MYHCLWWNTIRTNDATCAQKNTNEAKFSLLYWPIETELLLHRKHRRKAWCLLNYMHRRAYAPTSIELIAQNMTYIVIWSYIPCISSNTTSIGLNPITASWIFFPVIIWNYAPGIYICLLQAVEHCRHILHFRILPVSEYCILDPYIIKKIE